MQSDSYKLVSLPLYANLSPRRANLMSLVITPISNIFAILGPRMPQFSRKRAEQGVSVHVMLFNSLAFLLAVSVKNNLPIFYARETLTIYSCGYRWPKYMQLIIG